MIQYRQILLSVFIFLTGMAYGQTPVYTNIRILPPYSVYLNDYVSPGSNRLQIDLRLDDENEANREVKLRFTIKGNNITLQTKPDFQKKIILNSKIQETFAGDDDDIAPYFYQQNFNFQGNADAEQVFRRTNRLPEGYYQFYIEVLDYYRGTVISSQNVFSFAWLMLNDPPRWIMPSNNERVRATNPQNLYFQWLPMNTGSMNSAFSTEYEVTMVELWPVEQPANIALNNQSHFYQFTTEQTSFIMGPSEPAMVPGRKYAIRVRAKDKDGFDLFKNNGFSEPLVYTFGEECKFPLAITSKTPNYQTANIEWATQPGNTEFVVEYREKGQSDWYVQDKIFFNNSAINRLKPGTTYEYRISSLCGTIGSDPSEVASFTTPVKPEIVFECGKGQREEAGADNGKPNLSIGELITIRQHEIELTEVSGGSGKFTGKGIITVPFMSNIKMGVEFTNVAVNNENKITAGRVKFTSGKVSLLPQEWQDKLRPFAEGLDKARDYLNQLDKDLQELNNFLTSVQNLPEDARKTIQDGIDQVNKGKAEVRAKNTTIGNQDIADGKQKIQDGINIAAKALGTQIKMPAPSSSASIPASTSDKLKKNENVKVTFDQSQATDTKGGFDRKKYSQIENFYEQVIEEGSDAKVFVAWKAKDVSNPDFVKANVNISGAAKISGVKFADRSGNPIAAQTVDASTLQLTLQGGSDGQVNEIYATYTTTTTGTVSGTANIAKLNVVAYRKESNRLVIVPVKGSNISIPSNLGTILNNIYGQAIAEWTIDIKAPVELSPDGEETKDNKVEVGTSGLLSNYTNEMRNIISAYKDIDQQFDDNNYYLIVGLPASDVGVQGYMPRAKNIGFIFSGTSGLEKTIAHELGHGAFHLKHTFDELGLPREDDNLMDYSTGTTLLKYQWDNIHDPVKVLGFLEDDSSAKSVVVYVEINRKLRNPDSTYSFITPSAQLISLPKNVVKPTFLYGVESDQKKQMLTGSLISFTLDKVEYKADIKNGIFHGYVDNNYKPFDYKPGVTKPDGFLLGLPFSDFYKIQKFAITEGELPEYAPLKTDEVAGLISELYFAPVLYKKNAFLGEDNFSYKNSGVIGNEQNSVTPDQLEWINKHLKQPEILVIYKIGQLKQMYPYYFDNFTENFDDWNSVIQTYYPGNMGVAAQPIPLSVWDQYYYSNKVALKNKWANDPLAFYREFLSKFIEYIDQANKNKSSFLSTFDETTNQISTSTFLCSLSDDEFKALKCKTRLTILKSITSKGISDHQGCSNSEANVVKLVKFTPHGVQRDSLLKGLLTEKAYNKEYCLLKGLLGLNVDDLNGGEFVEMIMLLHEFASEYNIYNSVNQTALNKKENRYFSYDPATFTFSPSSLEISNTGNVWMAHRTQFTFWFFTNHYDVVDVNPYVSLTLHFDDDRTISNFKFRQDSTYTTSALIAYMLLYGGMKDQLMSQGNVVLNTLLFASGVGELRAAMSLGEEIAATTILDLGSTGLGLIMEAGLKNELNSTEKGAKVVQFWELADLSYGAFRISQTLYNAAVSAKAAAKDLPAANKELADQTIKATDEIIERVAKEGLEGAGNATKMIGTYEKATETLSLVSKDLDNIVDELPKGVSAISYDIKKIKIDGIEYDLPVKGLVFEENNVVKCYIEGGYCFPKGTPVTLKDGSKTNIEDLRIGDSVLTYNHQTKHTSKNVIRNIIRRTATRISTLLIAGSFISSTPEHPYFSNGNYNQAQSLKAGDQVLRADGSYAKVESVRTNDSITTVYNLDVENDHNFFAGDQTLLVHNNCGWLTVRTAVADQDLFRKFSNTIISASLESSERKALYDAIAKLSNRAEFVKDFASDTKALQAFAKDNNELIEFWSKASANTVLRSDANLLAKLREIAISGTNAEKSTLIARLIATNPSDQELKAFKESINQVDAANQKAFFRDIINNEALGALFVKKPENIKSWLFLDKSEGIRRSTENLESVSEILRAKPWSATDLIELGSAIDLSGSKKSLIEEVAKRIEAGASQDDIIAFVKSAASESARSVMISKMIITEMIDAVKGAAKVASSSIDEIATKLALNSDNVYKELKETYLDMLNDATVDILDGLSPELINAIKSRSLTSKQWLDVLQIKKPGSGYAYFQAHHEFMVNLLNPDLAASSGFFKMFANHPDKKMLSVWFNSEGNALFLPNKIYLKDGSEIIIHTNHPQLEQKIRRFCDKLWDNIPRVEGTDADVAKKMFGYLKELKPQLDERIAKECLGNKISINEIDLSDILNTEKFIKP